MIRLIKSDDIIDILTTLNIFFIKDITFNSFYVGICINNLNTAKKAYANLNSKQCSRKFVFISMFLSRLGS